MKKALFCIFALFARFGLFAQQQPVVAVAPFDAISGISSTDANMITRVFFIRLGNTNKVSLVDRNVVDRVLQEHQFQTGDWSNAQKTAELGSALNADWIVRGELEKFGNNILITVQFYDIQTFRFMGGGDLRIANADEAYDKMDPLVNKLVETIANTSRVTTTTTPSLPQSTGFSQAGKAIQNMQAAGLVAGHPSLPINSIVRITNASNGKEIEVKIIGRPSRPLSDGEIIDISPGAALALDIGFGGKVYLSVPGR